MRVLLAIVLVLSIVNAIVLFALASRRLRLSRHDRREAAIEKRFRPRVHEFLSGGSDLPLGLRRSEEGVLAEMLRRYARLLQGSSRRRIAEYFVRRGTVGREMSILASSKRTWRRARAAHVLGDIGSQIATPALIAALTDSRPDVRATAVRSLGKLGSPPEATEALIGAVTDRRVPDALGRWGLLQTGTRGLPVLRSLLMASRPDERATATQLIGFVGDASDATCVERGLHDGSASVRRESALALGRIGGEGDVAALMVTLDDQVPVVRAAAATALGRLRAPASATSLLSHARNDQFEVARAAAVALFEIDPVLATDTAAATENAHLLEVLDLGRLA